MVSLSRLWRSRIVLICVCLQVWIHAPSPRQDKVTKEQKLLLESLIEKKTIINLVDHLFLGMVLQLIGAWTGSSLLRFR
jgi:hypothetical protein